MLKFIMTDEEAELLQAKAILSSFIFIINKQTFTKLYDCKNAALKEIADKAAADSAEFESLSDVVDLCMSRSYIPKVGYESDDDVLKVLESYGKIIKFMDYKGIDDILRIIDWEPRLAKLQKYITLNMSVCKTVVNTNISKMGRKRSDLIIIHRMLRNMVEKEYSPNV